MPTNVSSVLVGVFWLLPMLLGVFWVRPHADRRGEAGALWALMTAFLGWLAVVGYLITLLLERRSNAARRVASKGSV